MKKYISKLHYLTHDLPSRSHIEQTEIACKAGANWIQYRCFSKDDEGLIKELHQIASICDDWGATLILTNHYHLLDKVDAQGVHLENMEADFIAIRNIISDEKTLGASANSIEDIQRIAHSGVVDYIGCGPFSHTATKPNDYPHLGVAGYTHIAENMQKNSLDIPVLAVGGVNIGDVDSLLSTGIYGIAVSAAVNHAEDPGQALKEFYRKTH
ncbi:thiamine phosphate synthase [Daejeonella lutea]|uniref:Thiamine-phosphate pyrophosphorylase n=1 Tax=Daejeonella lutea TaxID=572036 RepID=A0A1T5DS87_9SPHI|nr:thiamine phosphate synthase [Daejeonella lutea]SKB74390.1 thiamine-phosphate pyrophosphorylase [Daejeonella lutea]